MNLIKMNVRIAIAVTALAGFLASSAAVQAPQKEVYTRTFAVPLATVTAVDFVADHGDAEFSYNREGVVTMTASAVDGTGHSVPNVIFLATLSVERDGSHFRIRQSNAGAYLDAGLKLSYRFELPYRSTVNAEVGTGNLTLIGIQGPAKAQTAKGDILASYVGGGELEASTVSGNISCERVTQANVETTSGNIRMMECGPSQASVKKGFGTIEVGGARGGFKGSLDKGQLHIKAVLHDDWQLSSKSGGIRIELPSKATFDLDATSHSGEVLTARKDLATPVGGTHEFHLKAPGSGKHILAETDSGNIFIE